MARYGSEAVARTTQFEHGTLLNRALSLLHL